MPSRRSVDEIRSLIDGPINSIPTPFLDDGEVDWEGVRNIIDAGIAAGSKVVLLTAGDSQLMMLTDDETARLTKLVVEHTAGRALTVAATRLTSTEHAVKFARYCRDLGVNVMMPTPFNYGDSGPGIAAHAAFYAEIAAIMPTMIVGAPAFGVLESLQRQPNVIAFKEDGSEAYALHALARYAERFEILTGGTLWRHMMQRTYGCHAYFCLYLTFAPWIARDFEAAVSNGRNDEAVSIIRTTDMPFFELDGQSPGGIQPIWRALMKRAGHIRSARLRRPMVTLTDEQFESLETRLRAIDLIR